MSQAVEPVSRRNFKDIIVQLRDRAQKDPVFNAVCHRFAIRERARSQITMATLRLTMGREGFHYPTANYESILSFLANLGIGKLDYDSNKKLRSLKDIKLTLQSIGTVALAKSDKLDAHMVSNKYQDLQPAAPAVQPQKQAVLTVLIDGRPVNFPLPRPVSAEELGYILADLHSGANTNLKGRA